MTDTGFQVVRNVDINGDDFLFLPHSTQLLYFHLLHNADADGLIYNPSADSIIDNVGCNGEDLEMLVEEGYLIPLNERW